ncbi:glutamate--tRNA ligase [bacterium]|nr:glutamate--tRNA ligase [bacterium]
MIRVRFAPSPTGMLHLGNIRAALLNLLFAKQKDGVFVLRIEDTDKGRNLEEAEKVLVHDLHWLQIFHDEGFSQGGSYGPYEQSGRVAIHQEHLDKLVESGVAYKCFCSPERLEKVRQEQAARKEPPRYDRACRSLAEEEIEQKISENCPWLWRFKIEDEKIEVNDMARGKVDFDMSHFSDFPITRSDGSFSFVFANAIDDLTMQISHVIRGEDHLSNTALQVAVLRALGHKPPTFWHLPMLCNENGIKMSKRDRGFSLNDLRESGFLPHAIVNYLAIVGGSFDPEIQSLEELTESYNFEKITSTGAIKFDRKKLEWLNEQWIKRINAESLASYAHPFVDNITPEKPETVAKKLLIVQGELKTLAQLPGEYRFLFENPITHPSDLAQEISEATINSVATSVKNLDAEDLTGKLKALQKDSGMKPREFFSTIRFALTGATRGMGIAEIIKAIGAEEALSRISEFFAKQL